MHHTNKIINKDIFINLKKENEKIKEIYDFEYDIKNIATILPFKEKYPELFNKPKNRIFKVFIIISFLVSPLKDIIYLYEVANNLIDNYLSYIYLISNIEINDEELNLFYLPINHIKKFRDKKDIENVIKEDIISNRIIEIRNNYKKYCNNSSI